MDENYPHNSFVYYVKASSGSDSNDGLTDTTAFETIEKALSFLNNGSPDVKMFIEEPGDYTINGFDWVGCAVHIIAKVNGVNIVIDTGASSFALYNVHLNIRSDAGVLTMKGDTFHLDNSDIVAQNVVIEQDFNLYGSSARFEQCSIKEIFAKNSTIDFEETDINNTDPNRTPLEMYNTNFHLKGEWTIANLSSAGIVPFIYAAGGQLSMESGFFNTIANKYTYTWELHESILNISAERYLEGSQIAASRVLNESAVVTAKSISGKDGIVYESGWSGTNIVLKKTANDCILSGFFTKTSNIADGNDICTLPAGFRPDDNYYSSVASGTSGKTARVDVGTDGIVTIRDPSSSMTTAVFQIQFFI